MASKILGINFGVTALDIVEVDKKDVKKHYHIDYHQQDEDESIVDATDEIKITALLQKILRANKIETKEVIATVPSEDVLLRSFLIPPVSSKEVQAVVEFEARKFIPFKLEELYFDFITQNVKESGGRRLKVYFAGIKKEFMEQFEYILGQSGLRTVFVEPASFSILRLFSFKKIVRPEQTFALVEVAEDRGSICIVEKGYPQLIRDFRFRQRDIDIDTGEDVSGLTSRLLSEIHVSFDYYRRQFSSTAIERVFLHASEKLKDAQDSLHKEIGVPVESIAKKLEFRDNFELGAFKAYGATLRQVFS